MRAPPPAKASPIASSTTRSRPSETFGTARSSGSDDRVDGEQQPGEDDDQEAGEQAEGVDARHGRRIITLAGMTREPTASFSACSPPPPHSQAPSPTTARSRSASPRARPGAGASPADRRRGSCLLMEAVILCGVQGSGKTTLYRDRFLETHVRVSMDLHRTRAREAAFLRTCLETRMPFVVDNTNPTVAERARYVT